ncbi:VP7 [Erinnyis ello cypovirus 2]|nr:VP7 [Erinnyis ello cypovirus 2]
MFRIGNSNRAGSAVSYVMNRQTFDEVIGPSKESASIKLMTAFKTLENGDTQKLKEVASKDDIAEFLKYARDYANNKGSFTISDQKYSKCFLLLKTLEKNSDTRTSLISNGIIFVLMGNTELTEVQVSQKLKGIVRTDRLSPLEVSAFKSACGVLDAVEVPEGSKSSRSSVSTVSDVKHLSRTNSHAPTPSLDVAADPFASIANEDEFEPVITSPILVPDNQSDGYTSNDGVFTESDAPNMPAETDNKASEAAITPSVPNTPLAEKKRLSSSIEVKETKKPSLHTQQSSTSTESSRTEQSSDTHPVIVGASQMRHGIKTNTDMVKYPSTPVPLTVVDELASDPAYANTSPISYALLDFIAKHEDIVSAPFNFAPLINESEEAIPISMDNMLDELNEAGFIHHNTIFDFSGRGNHTLTIKFDPINACLTHISEIRVAPDASTSCLREAQKLVTLQNMRMLSLRTINSAIIANNKIITTIKYYVEHNICSIAFMDAYGAVIFSSSCDLISNPVFRIMLTRLLNRERVIIPIGGGDGSFKLMIA